jgi:hypothetical protein
MTRQGRGLLHARPRDYGALNGRALSRSDRPLRRRFFGRCAVFLPRPRRLGGRRGVRDAGTVSAEPARLPCVEVSADPHNEGRNIGFDQVGCGENVLARRGPLQTDREMHTLGESCGSILFGRQMPAATFKPALPVWPAGSCGARVRAILLELVGDHDAPSTGVSDG